MKQKIFFFGLCIGAHAATLASFGQTETDLTEAVTAPVLPPDSSAAEVVENTEATEVIATEEDRALGKKKHRAGYWGGDFLSKKAPIPVKKVPVVRTTKKGGHYRYLEEVDDEASMIEEEHAEIEPEHEIDEETEEERALGKKKHRTGLWNAGYISKKVPMPVKKVPVVRTTKKGGHYRYLGEADDEEEHAEIEPEHEIEEETEEERALGKKKHHAGYWGGDFLSKKAPIPVKKVPVVRTTKKGGHYRYLEEVDGDEASMIEEEHAEIEPEHEIDEETEEERALGKKKHRAGYWGGGYISKKGGHF